MKKLIIVPAYNEEENIPYVLETLSHYADYDVVVIDDCSTDQTLAKCRELQQRFANVHLLSLTYNLGIGGAVQTGYRYAWKNGYDIAIQMDGDGQHDPTFLDSLTLPIENGDTDMTIGSRFLEKKGFQSSSLRRFGISFFRLLVHVLTGKTIYDMTSGFRAVSRKIIIHFAEDYPVDYPEPETNARLLRLGYRLKEIPVIMHTRRAGNSSISYTDAVWYMFKVTAAILIDYLRTDKGRKQ